MPPFVMSFGTFYDVIRCLLLFGWMLANVGSV